VNILVLGSNGQVGSHLRNYLPQATFWTRSDLDLAETSQIEARITSAAPDVIVNCAAYTAVDTAEEDPAGAWQINAQAPSCLAAAARTTGAHLIHFSTDYVFSGESDKPYIATDPTNPINTYGRTKLGGELAIQAIAPSYWIFRTSWVFSEYSKNFVKTIVRLAQERDALSVVSDQVGVPTDAQQLASAAAELVSGEALRNLASGTYHLTGSASTSWYDFAAAILQHAEDQCLIAPPYAQLTKISTSEYPTLAVRPMSSVLRPDQEVLDEIETQFDWEAGLRRVMSAMQAVEKAT
jgi:dTDP-4-dehydrorhamnose reductase